MSTSPIKTPFVSFCMSTYKRPGFLEKQLSSILQQTYPDFEVIISDNDIEKSALAIVNSFNDKRLKYFNNGVNIGMIKSFNRSIDEAVGLFVVMITDDDPVEIDFIERVKKLNENYPGYSIYAGFERINKPYNQIEIIKKDDFLIEILDYKKTKSFLWSSCIINRGDLLKVGKLPDYNSPHLFDHAMLVMVGSVNGAVIINKVFSYYALHETNYSKTNFDSYFSGCIGFYNLMNKQCSQMSNRNKCEEIVLKHISDWFITNIFSLKKYYYLNNSKFPSMQLEIDYLAKRILSLDFMRKVKTRFILKNSIFQLKKIIYNKTKKII